MLLKPRTLVLLTLQRYCFCMMNRALWITALRIGSILGALATLFYMGALSLRALQNQRNSGHNLHPEKSFQGSKVFENCDEKIRGVNLGGWLVLEPWITPGIFEEVNVGRLKGAILDEWTYYQNIPETQALARLER